MTDPLPNYHAIHPTLVGKGLKQEQHKHYCDFGDGHFYTVTFKGHCPCGQQDGTSFPCPVHCCEEDATT